MDFIFDLLDSLWCMLQQGFYFVINNLFKIIDIVGQFVLMILPNTPFEFEQLDWGIFGNVIGFFIPVATIVAHFIGILTAIAIYYSVRSLLRLIKQVG